MDVSDRSLQVKLTQEAKITSTCFLSEVIFAFGSFFNALKAPPHCGGAFYAQSREKTMHAPPCGAIPCREGV